MMKHTPGPWHYQGDSLTHRQFDIYAPAQSPQQHIATVNNLSVERLYTRDAENALANARLIASAADLLSALSQLIDAAVAVYDGRSEDFPGLVEATEAACRVYEQATAE